MGDVQTLPANVVDLWRRYFQMLEGHEKALLRCLMIFSKVEVRGIKSVVEKFYLFNGNTYSEFCDALETLERQLWIVKTEYGYDCHDVQLEAVPFEGGILERLKEFIINENLDVYLSLFLNFGISKFHYAKIAGTGNYKERIFHVVESIRYSEKSLKICRDLGLRADLSMSLNNASSFYSQLSSLQQTREERLESIQTAVNYIEEAIQIGKDLGLILNLAYSMAVSVFVYDSYLEFDSKVFTRAMANCNQAINIFLEFRLKNKYCPLLSFGIKYYHLMYTITQSPEHQAIINTYQQLLTQCPQ